MNKKNYTAETKGTIIKSLLASTETPRLTVAYTVAGQDYTITENVTSKSEAIKIGFIPIGQRKVWQVKKINVGEELTIIYDPNNPRKAHIKGNDGKYC